MEKDIEDLRSLIANTSASRSKMGRVRGLYSEIMNAQSKGVSQAEIVAFLNNKGLDISVGNLRTMLARIKKEGLESTPEKLNPLDIKHQHKTIKPKDIEKPKITSRGILSQDTRPGEPKKFDWENLKNVTDYY